MRNRSFGSVVIYLRVLVALVVTFFSRSAFAETADKQFRVIKTTDKGPLVEVGSGTSVQHVINSFKSMYKASMLKDSDVTNDEEELDWEKIYAANRGRKAILPICTVKNDGAMWRGRDDESVWENCAKNHKNIILVAGHSGQFIVPIQSIVTIDQKVDCYDNATCLQKRLTQLGTPPVVVPPQAVATAPVEPVPFIANPETDAKANAGCASLVDENNALKERIQKLETRPTPGKMWFVVVLFCFVTLLIGMVIGKRAFTTEPEVRYETEIKPDPEDQKRLKRQAVEIANLLQQRADLEEKVAKTARELKKAQEDLREHIRNEEKLGRDLVAESLRVADIDAKLARQLEESAKRPNNTYSPEQAPLRSNAQKERAEAAIAELEKANANIATLEERIGDLRTQLDEVSKIKLAAVNANQELARLNNELEEELATAVEAKVDADRRLAQFDEQVRAFGEESVARISYLEDEVPRSLRMAEDAEVKANHLNAENIALAEKVRLLEATAEGKESLYAIATANIAELEAKVKEVQDLLNAPDQPQRVRMAMDLLKRESDKVTALSAKVKELERASDPGDVSNSGLVATAKLLEEARAANEAQLERIGELKAKSQAFTYLVNGCLTAHRGRTTAERSFQAHIERMGYASPILADMDPEGAQLREDLQTAIKSERAQRTGFFSALAELANVGVESVSALFAPPSQEEGPMTARGLGAELPPGNGHSHVHVREAVSEETAWSILANGDRREPVLITGRLLGWIEQLLTRPAVCDPVLLENKPESYQRFVLNPLESGRSPWRIGTLSTELIGQGITPSKKTIPAPAGIAVR